MLENDSLDDLRSDGWPYVPDKPVTRVNHSDWCIRCTRHPSIKYGRICSFCLTQVVLRLCRSSKELE